jgi:hypothetical protein
MDDKLVCQTVGDELFFTWRIFLEVGKTQYLSSKFWQTFGDALSLLNCWGSFFLVFQKYMDTSWFAKLLKML